MTLLASIELYELAFFLLGVGNSLATGQVRTIVAQPRSLILQVIAAWFELQTSK